MTPIDGIDLPPVKVATSRGHEKLLELRLRDLRARGVAYEVIHLDELLRPDGDGDRR